MVYVLIFSEKVYSFILIILTLLSSSTLNFCNQDMHSTVSVASFFSSIAQARAGYFGTELLKTERKEERNLHTIVVQKKQMLKLNSTSPKRCIKFTNWLCKQITPHRLWWQWLKCKEVHLYDDTNRALPLKWLSWMCKLFLSKIPQETLFQLQTQSVHGLYHDIACCRTKNQHDSLNVEIYTYAHTLSSVENRYSTSS